MSDIGNPFCADMASADLITVLRHAERAHQELKGGSK